MASCYICGCYVKGGEGYRRKVLVGESARIYFSRRGGGSYGQTYALRTLCESCARQLDERNRSLAWKLPLSIVMALVGCVFAVRYALRSGSYSDSALESLICAFFLFGGGGLITYCLLSFMEAGGDENAEDNGQGFLIGSGVNSNKIARADISGDVKKCVLSVAERIEQFGISLYGCYGLERDPTNFPFLIDAIKIDVDPECFDNIYEWEVAASMAVINRYLSAFQDATNPVRIDRMNIIFPQIPDETLEEYSERIQESTNMLVQVVSTDAV